MALFGSATPLSRIIGMEFPVFAASFARMAIASLVLLPFVLLVTPRYSHMQRSDIWVMAAIALAGMVGFTASMLFGMRMTTGVIGSTIMSSAPAVTALGAVIFLGAAMNWRKSTALALAVAGSAVVNLFRDQSAGEANAVLAGAALVALAVCFEAAFTLLSRRLSEGITSLETMLGASLIALPLFALLSVMFEPVPLDFSGAGTQAWLALLFWAAVTAGLAPVLWFNGVRQVPPALSASAMGVMPLSALSLSYLLLGESFQWTHLAGFGLVFSGLVLMIIEHASED